VHAGHLDSNTRSLMTAISSSLLDLTWSRAPVLASMSFFVLYGSVWATPFWNVFRKGFPVSEEWAVALKAQDSYPSVLHVIDLH